MQRILHRINWNVVGGTETLFAEFLRREAGIGERVHDVLMLGRPHPFYRDAAEVGADRVISRKFAGRVKIPRWPPLLRRWHVRREVARVVPDVFLSWDCLANRELSELAQDYRRPLIYQEQGSSWDPKLAPDAVTSFLDDAAGALCNTNAARRMLRLRWGYDGPTQVNLNGLRPVVTSTPAPERSYPKDRPLRLGMMCRLVPVKGVNLVLHAAALLRGQDVDFELEIAGEGAEKPRLQALAERLGLSDRVRWHGLVRDVVGFYDSVDVLLAPSLSESFGLVSIEAAARGCPVIIAGVDGLAETVEDGRTGYRLWPERPLPEYADYNGDPRSVPGIGYDPQQDRIWEPRFLAPETIAQACRRMFADPGDYEAMSREAAAWSRTTFSFEGYMERLLSGVHELTA